MSLNFRTKEALDNAIVEQLAVAFIKARVEDSDGDMQLPKRLTEQAWKIVDEYSEQLELESLKKIDDDEEDTI
jgi:hypothetical protein